MSKIFKDLKEGLEEFIRHEKGEIKLRTTSIEVPEPPISYRANDIKKIREKQNYSQGVFAKVLNVSIKTIQSWESGARKPNQAALRLLEIVDKGIYKPNLNRRN